jgi:hypothetical protein
LVTNLAVIYYQIHPNHGFILVIIKYAKKSPVHPCTASAQFRTQTTVVIFWQFIIFGGALAPKHATASHKANVRSERRDEEHMTSL